MEIAKVFQTGRSQAVRLPKAFRFNGTEVAIKTMNKLFGITLDYARIFNQQVNRLAT